MHRWLPACRARTSLSCPPTRWACCREHAAQCSEGWWMKDHDPRRVHYENAALGAALSFFACVAVVLVRLFPQHLTADQAKDHIGERAKLCGLLASARYAETSGGSPTFLNLDRPYPQHVLRLPFGARTRPNLAPLRSSIAVSESARRARSRSIRTGHRSWQPGGGRF